MRKHLLHLCLILSSVLLIGATAVAPKWLSVKWVSDGDTIVLSDGRYVRYIGINAPEIAHDNHRAEAFGYAAKKYNQSLLRSKKVRLEFDIEHFSKVFEIKIENPPDLLKYGDRNGGLLKVKMGYSLALFISSKSFCEIWAGTSS